MTFWSCSELSTIPAAKIALKTYHWTITAKLANGQYRIVYDLFEKYTENS